MIVGTLHIELDEGASQLLIFPRCAGFAGAQANHRVAHANRLSGPQREVADDAVALVEEAKNRDPLRHWRHPGVGVDRFGHVDRDRIFVAAIGLGRTAIAPHRQQQR